MKMGEIKSETAHAQSIASKFKGKSSHLSITKDSSSHYGGQAPASQTIDEMTNTLPKIESLMNKLGSCLETIAHNIEKVDESYGG